MAFAFVQQATANGNSSAPHATYLATPTQGNLLIFAAFSNIATAITLSGWNALTSLVDGTGVQALRIFWKIAGASEPTLVTAAGGSAVWSACVEEYTPPAGTVVLDTDNVQANASGTVTTPTLTPVAGESALVFCFIGVQANATWSAEQVNGSATGVSTRSTRSNAATSIVGFDVLPASTTGSYQGSATASVSGVGVGGLAIFSIAAAAVGVPASRPRAWVLSRGVRDLGQMALRLQRVAQPSVVVVAANLGAVATSSSSAASVPVTAAALLSPSAAAISAASALLTAATAFTVSAGAVSAATVPLTAPSLITVTAASSTAATAAVTAAALLTPTASAVSAASALVTAQTFLSPSAQAVTAAIAPVSAQTFLSVSAQAVTAASAPVSAQTFLAPSAQAVTASSGQTTVPQPIAPTAGSVTAAGVPMTAPALLSPTGVSVTAASAPVTIPSGPAMIVPVAGAISAASVPISAATFFAPVAAAMSTASVPLTASGSLAPVAGSISSAQVPVAFGPPCIPPAPANTGLPMISTLVRIGGAR